MRSERMRFGLKLKRKARWGVTSNDNGQRAPAQAGWEITQSARKKIGVRRAQQVRSGRGRPDRRAAASLQALELVRIEEVDLPVADRVHDGPVVPHAPPQPDEDGPPAAILQERHHLGPEFIEGCFGAMLERHVPFMNCGMGDVPQDTAHRVQADSLRQHSAEVFPVFQVGQDVFRQSLGFVLPGVGDDPGGVDDAVYGAQAVQRSLEVGPISFPFMYSEPPRREMRCFAGVSEIAMALASVQRPSRMGVSGQWVRGPGGPAGRLAVCSRADRFVAVSRCGAEPCPSSGSVAPGLAASGNPRRVPSGRTTARIDLAGVVVVVMMVLVGGVALTAVAAMLVPLVMRGGVCARDDGSWLALLYSVTGCAPRRGWTCSPDKSRAERCQSGTRLHEQPRAVPRRPRPMQIEAPSQPVTSRTSPMR